MKNRELKVAIVCDWLTGAGGAERVVLELHRMFPKAPIYTSQYNKNPKVWFGDKWFEDADIRTGWLQKLPKFLKKFLPVFRAWYFSRLKLDDYDLVISSSGAEAKFIKLKAKGQKPKAMHITYCHSPTHYYWSRYEDYLNQPGFGPLDSLARLALRILVGPMRRWDFKAAQRPDYFIANSKHTKQEIKKYYGRDATVIYPPVEVERFGAFSQSAEKRHGFVVAGRQTPYKRIDLAVKAATEANVPLIVIGKGPEHRKLKKVAGRNVTFLSKVSDQQMPEILGGAKGFIFPGIDDFGIVAVEALAAGTPLIAFRGGGALDYVNQKTGVFFDQQNADSLKAAMVKFSERNFDYTKVQSEAGQFSAKTFRTSTKKFIDSTVKSIHHDPR